MHKIVLLDKPRENPGELDWSPLQALGETTFYTHTEPEEAAARIGDAEIVLLNKTVLTAETLRQCKNLKLISVIATGYNTVDVDCCRELGIAVCNVPSYGSEAISQNAIALLLGQPSQSDNCIIILNIEDTLVGILVDTVQKMIDVDTALILPSPSQDTRNLVSGMCSLSEEQTMLVFDCPQILNQP